MINEIINENIIERKFYTNQIKQYFDSPVIKVIVGMRRVGKSYILKSLLKNFVINDKIPLTNIFYINKEDLLYDNILDYNDLNKLFLEFIKNTNSKYKIIIAIDEIQEIINWEKFINNALLKYHNKSEIFITGSNSTLLSSELSSFLTGRYIEFNILPLSLEEYSLFTSKNISKHLFLEYIKYGGLPGNIYMTQSDEIIFNYLKSIYSTIVLKDIIKTFGVRNLNFFENLYKYVFSNIGNIFSSKNISDYLKSQKINISPETVLNYLGYGIKTYLLDIIKAYDPDTKKYFEIYNKYYVGDIGLRNSIVGFNPLKDIGKILENYTYLELKRYGFNSKLVRLKSNKEIDFVAEKFGKKIYIQVCTSILDEHTKQREYGSLYEIKDNWPKYIVTMDDVNFGNIDGIQHINIINLNTILS